MHDTVGCYLDLGKNQISFAKNGAVVILIRIRKYLNFLPINSSFN